MAVDPLGVGNLGLQMALTMEKFEALEGDPVKMTSISIENNLPPVKKIEQLSYNLTALLPCLPDLWSVFKACNGSLHNCGSAGCLLFTINIV
ncbi:hypothetical protein JHK85_010545 [Glycine max]|nr:hypothetical protein JHK85_010545 [Glycine max]